MIDRILSSSITKTSKSILLLGPRQVGKSTLIQSIKPELQINLADQEQYIEFQSQEGLLREIIEAKQPKTIFIDEIQRIPELTNTIQALIDEKKSRKFFLTGSSARKLKRGNANLLPGRIFSFRLGPLCARELDYGIHDTQALSFGCLPEVYFEKDPEQKELLLKNYSTLYLKEEIQAEALVRTLPGFVRFLNIAATYSGQYLDYSKLAKLAKIPRQSAVRHFEILEDTLIIYRIECDQESNAKDLVKHPRYFFFDVGVLNGLLGNFTASLDRQGMLFEHLFVSNLYSSFFAHNKDPKISNFRTRGGLEVDLIVQVDGKRFAIELKSSSIVSSDTASRLRKVDAYYSEPPEKLIAYRGTKERKDQNVWILPWTKVLQEIGL